MYYVCIGPLILDKIGLGIKSGRGMLFASRPVREQRAGALQVHTAPSSFCRRQWDHFFSLCTSSLEISTYPQVYLLTI